MRAAWSIQKLLLEDKIAGKRGRGRPNVTWMKNIKEWLGHTYNGCVRRAEDRNSWRSMIADLLLIDGTLSGAPNGPMFPNTPEVFQMVLSVL